MKLSDFSTINCSTVFKYRPAYYARVSGNNCSVLKPRAFQTRSLWKLLKPKI